MIRPGDLVTAIHGIEGDTAFIYGHGTYLGQGSDKDINVSKPNIILDNGKNMFGIECCWGLVDNISNLIGKKNIIFVDPDEIRKINNIKKQEKIQS